MARITDYILNYGNVSLSNLSFNHLDASIITQLTLLDLSGVIGKDSITIKEAYSKYVELEKDKDRREGLLVYRRIASLFRLMSEKDRFANLLISDYVEIIDVKNPCQFSAITIHLNKKLLVCFGGTDDTIVGWHEDFLLLYKEEIPSHEYGLKYLEMIAEKYDYDFIICGHSKGANIAMNVTLWTPDEIERRIIKVYCYDGPGINKKEFDNKSLANRIAKITSYIPYRSSVGKLFEHYEKYEIVECSANLLFQHDISTWHVDYVDFVYKDEESSESLYLDSHLKKLVSELNDEDKENFVTSLFRVLYASEVENYREALRFKRNIIRNILKLNRKERKLFNKIIFKGMIKDAKIRKMLISILREKRKIY